MGGYGATRIGMKHADVFGSLYIMSPCCLSPRGAGGGRRADRVTVERRSGTVAIGSATVLLTLVSGSLFDRFGAHGFWGMAVLPAAALPFTWTLREPVVPVPGSRFRPR